MNSADGTVARHLGDALVAVWDFVYWLFAALGPAWVVIGLVMLWVLWRVSLTFGPLKVCWRCKGDGHVGGWFGGRRQCPTCAGKGTRPRVGSK